MGGTDSLGHIIYGDGFGSKMEPWTFYLQLLYTVIEIATKHLLQLLDRQMLVSLCETILWAAKSKSCAR